MAVWTPEGRRCLTGTQSGEFTLWNGSQFNFETILQARLVLKCGMVAVHPHILGYGRCMALGCEF